jgi:phosphotransferase system HPr (HPr) family protein
MIALDRSAVRIGARPANKIEAIRQVGQILVDAGNIDAGYIESMLAREKVANTFLGNGIAIRPEDLPNHFDIVIDTPHGLHARPATAQVDIAKGFESTIRIRREDRVGDAKSLISLLNLGVDGGASIRVMAEGRDADAALAALRGAIEAGLEEAAEAAAAPAGPAIEWEAHTVSGVAASPGIAVGPVCQLQRRRGCVPLSEAEQTTRLHPEPQRP